MNGRNRRHRIYVREAEKVSFNVEVKMAEQNRERKVLVVDDDADIRLLLSMYLTDKGYSVDMAPNGLFGLKLAEGIDYIAIITDYHMPVMDGITMMVEARRRGINTPILIHTGENLERMIKLSDIWARHNVTVVSKGVNYDYIDDFIKQYESK